MKKTVLVIGMTGIIGITGILGMTACAKKAPQESIKATEASTEIKVGEEGESAEKKAAKKPLIIARSRKTKKRARSPAEKPKKSLPS